MSMSSFRSNAFALLEGDEGENLFPLVPTAPVKEEAPPSPVNKHRNGDRRKALTSSHEKLESDNRNLDRQTRNRGGFERRNRNGANTNSSNGGGNGDSKTKEEEEGWETVVRAKLNKQSNANANSRGRGHSRNYNGSSNVGRANGYKRGNVNANSRGNSRNNNGNGNGNGSENGDALKELNVDGSESVEVAAEENGKASESKELLPEKEVEAEGDSAKEDKVQSKEEIERLELEAKILAEREAKKLERELEAKKMTLKQYEKVLEEKRKVLESMKTEERRVAHDTYFNSMQVIAKKKNIEEDAKIVKLNINVCDKQKKVISNKDDKGKNIVISQRFHRRGNIIPVSIEKGVSPLPPSFEDVDQFPALTCDGTTKGK